MAIVRASMESALFLVCLAVASCSADSETDQGNDDDSGADSGDSSTDSDDGTDPPIESCETRQQGPDGALAGPTDMQAQCQDYVVALNRPGSVECTTDNLEYEPCTTPGTYDECASDTDCTSLLGGGSCRSFDGLGSVCACLLPCATDDECPADRACLCRSAAIQEGGVVDTIVYANGCWPATCRSDAECGAGGTCSTTNPLRTCVYTPSLACKPSTATCQTDADCEDGYLCEYKGGETWVCAGGGDCQ